MKKTILLAKKSLKKQGISFFSSLLLLSGSYLAAQETPEQVQDPIAVQPETVSVSEGETCDILGEGPCTTDDTKRPIVAPGSNIMRPQRDPKTIDLAKEPWLVESKNLSKNHPAFQRARMIWADSLLWTPLSATVDEIDVEEWVNHPPKDLNGKYVFIEVWATWCPPCRRSLPYLNYLQEKFGDQLVVVSICETNKEAIKAMPGGFKIEDAKFSLAIDTGRRFANKINVWGVPHAILIEPVMGGIIWEGMPTLPGYELDAETVEKFLSVGKKLKEKGKIPETPTVKFKVSKPDPSELGKRPAVQFRNVETELPEENNAENQDIDGGPSLSK